MQTYPLVSVIIPVYNVGKYLCQCVDSVLAQTYQNLEILIIDDGSTDASPAICDTYARKDQRIVVSHYRNGGLSFARNMGMQQASGAYLYFLDSDDYIEHDCVEHLVHVAADNDFVFFDAHSFIDGQSKNIPQRYIRKHQHKTTNGVEMLESLYQQNEFHSAVQLFFVKRSYVQNNRLQFQGGIVYEDMLFATLLFACNGKVAHLHKPLYHRRYRKNSIMTGKRTAHYFHSNCVVYEQWFKFLNSHHLLKVSVLQKHLVRCASHTLIGYRHLSYQEKRKCKAEYQYIKQHILKNQAYGDKALHMKCYSDIHWFVYKIYQKTIGRWEGVET